MPRHLPLDPHTNHPFNLQKCLEGRQDFRWRKLPNAYHSVVLNNTLIHIRQTEDRLTYRSTPDADLTDLLTPTSASTTTSTPSIRRSPPATIT